MNAPDTFAVLGQTVLGGVRRTTCASRIRNSSVRSTTCDHDEPLKSEAGSSEVGLMTTCRIVASGQCRQTPSSACDVAVDVEPDDQAQWRSLSV